MRTLRALARFNPHTTSGGGGAREEPRREATNSTRAAAVSDNTPRGKSNCDPRVPDKAEKRENREIFIGTPFIDEALPASSLDYLR
jgi:hypothetical protein